ncbi:phage tail protein, partial [Brachyspira intermedia]
KELLDEGLINQDEYNQRTNKKREKEYEIKTDKQVLELTRSFFNRNINNLAEEEKLMLDEINNTVANIKQEYPKQN